MPMIEPIRSLHRRLEATAGAVRSLVTGIELEEARWKPAPDRWSILEVVNHLGDEEVEDFRTRLDILLHRPADAFPPVDPPGWVTAREYGSRDPGESLARFLAERERSLKWLEGLEIGLEDLDRAKVRPSGHSSTARELVGAWAAHDLLHVRQITKLRYDYLAHEVAPLSLEYAGRW
jgi:hypothetical protein